MNDRCLFCGGDARDRDHLLHCDGRQGKIEAAAAARAWPAFDDAPGGLYGRQGDTPYETTSDTSAAAAGTVTRADLARDEAIVYRAIEARPRTCDEVEYLTGLAHQTASARIRGLVLRARVVDSGERRRTRRNRPAVVWRASE
jgi:hypothetical protein